MAEILCHINYKKKREDILAKKRRKTSRKQRRYSNPVAVKTVHRSRSYRRRNPVFSGGVKGLWSNLEMPLGVAGGFGGVEWVLNQFGLEKGTPARILAPVVGGYLLSNVGKQGVVKGVGIGMIANGIIDGVKMIMSKEFGDKKSGTNGNKKSGTNGVGNLFYDPQSGKVIDTAMPAISQYQPVNGLGESSAYNYKRIGK